MKHMVVTYDNGQPDKIDVLQNIPQGGESREIDLKGIGKHSVRRIDFWYDTKGFLKGRADVVVFGKKWGRQAKIEDLKKEGQSGQVLQPFDTGWNTRELLTAVSSSWS